MANAKDVRKVNPVVLELGGKARTLHFDMNAMIELENRYGSVNDAMQQLASNKIVHVRTILWASLIHEEAILDEVTGEPVGYNITPYQVGSWITPQTMGEVTEALGRAIGADLPAPDNITKDGQATAKGKQANAVGKQVAAIVPTADEIEAQQKNG